MPKFYLPLKRSDNPASANALARELGGKVKGTKIVFDADDQAHAKQKVGRATSRAIRKGK